MINFFSLANSLISQFRKKSLMLSRPSLTAPTEWLPIWRSKTEIRPMRLLNWLSIDFCFTESFTHSPLTNVTSGIIHHLCRALASDMQWNLYLPAVNNIWEQSWECAASPEHNTKYISFIHPCSGWNCANYWNKFKLCFGCGGHLHSLCLCKAWHLHGKWQNSICTAFREPGISVDTLASKPANKWQMWASDCSFHWTMRRESQFNNSSFIVLLLHH